MTSGSRARASRLEGSDRRFGHGGGRFLCSPWRGGRLKAHEAKKDRDHGFSIPHEQLSSGNTMNEGLYRSGSELEQADLAEDGCVVPVDPFAGDLVTAKLDDDDHDDVDFPGRRGNAGEKPFHGRS